MLISREQFMALTARVNDRYLPWLNVVQGDLTLSRLARLSLFQVSVGICFVLLNGTLNRIMVVELGQPAWMVALMVAGAEGLKSGTIRLARGKDQILEVAQAKMKEFAKIADEDWPNEEFGRLLQVRMLPKP